MQATFRLATMPDLSTIVDIYNQSIPVQTITADLKPVTVAQRQDWFLEHQQNPLRPLWVILQKQQIIGWASLSDFYGRAAYQTTSEISLYLDKNVQHQGLGQATLDFIFPQLKSLHIKTIVAYIFSANLASEHLFSKNNFQRWGHLPAVANNQGKVLDLDIWGRHFQDFCSKKAGH